MSARFWDMEGNGINKWQVVEVPALSRQPETGWRDVSVKPVQAPGSWRASRRGGTRQTWSEIRKTLRHSSSSTFLLQERKTTGTSLKALDWTKPVTKESESEGPLGYKQTHWQVLSLLSSQSGLLLNTHLLSKWKIHCFHLEGCGGRGELLCPRGGGRKTYRYWYFAILHWNRQIIVHCPRSEPHQ